MAQAGSVEALLKLNASGFDTGITKSIDKVTEFAETMNKLGKNSTEFNKGMQEAIGELNRLHKAIEQLENAKGVMQFTHMANGLKNLVNAAIKFNKEGGVTVTTFSELGRGIQSFMNALGGVEVKLTNVINSEYELVRANNQLNSSSNNAARGVQWYDTALQNPAPLTFKTNVAGISATMTSTTSSVTAATTAIERYNIALSTSGTSGLVNMTTGVSNLNTTMNGNEVYTSLARRGIIDFGEAAGNTKTKVNETSTAMTTAGKNTDNFKNKVGGLTQSLGMLRTMVSMVGSMFIYNFAHNLGISVQNTVKAKSEMESFLHTMGLTKGQIDDFNTSLDATAERFQRINKYNVGETVANIGLEFNLSTQEMKKAMSVTSMITSEYLRAGRNADEAALAVKDILQGQFQRLSRETGVKGETLKEFGWSGDETDVMGLMDALEKAAKARHWDVFAEKASSLNDIVLITQNRLSEWAADMSEGIVPIITGSFNALINALEKITGFFTGLGEALHLPDWTGTAVILGGITAAIGGLVLATITWRTELGLLQIAQNGLTQSLVAAVFGIKAEEMANAKATTVLKAKILGVKAETLANTSSMTVIKSKILGINAETVAEKGLTEAVNEAILKKKAEELANDKITISNGRLLTSYISLKTGIGMNTLESFKWYQQLALLNKETTLAQANNMGFLRSIYTMIRGVGAARIAVAALTASIVALAAVAVGGFIIATTRAANTMKNFNDLVDNGEEKIRKIKEVFGETSEQADKMTEAVERARSAMSKFEERKAAAEDRAGRTIGNYLKDIVKDEERLNELTNTYMADANAGVSQVAHTGDLIEKTWRGAANQVGMYAEKVQKLRGDDGLDEYVRNTETRAARISAALEKTTMSDSAIDRGFGWIDLQIEYLGNFWDEFSLNLESQDYGAAWDNIWKSFMLGFSHIPVASDIWNTIFKSIKLEDHIVKGDVLASLGKIGEDIFNAIKDALPDPVGAFNDWFNSDDIFKTVREALPDPVGVFNDWFNTVDVGMIFDEKIKQPIMDWWNGLGDWFMSYLTNPLGTDVDMIGSIFKALFGEDTYNQVVEAADNYIIKPLAEGIDMGIANIPILGSILQMLGLIDGGSGTASEKGTNIGSSFGTALEGYVRNIPILGDLLVLFGIIDGQKPTANSKGGGIGKSITDGFKDKLNIVDLVKKEIDEIGKAIDGKLDWVKKKAGDLGAAINNGFNNLLQHNSPGIPAQLTAAEMDEIENALSNGVSGIYTQAQNVGNALTTGLSVDATDVSQDTIGAFDTMGTDISGSFTMLDTNVSSTMGNISNSQATMLNNMQTTNKNAFTNIQSQNNKSLGDMRDSTSKTTQQMTQAWNLMKDNIIASANQLKTQSTQHFNTLSSNIGGFYKKLQNPSMWGAGSYIGVRHYGNNTANGLVSKNRVFGRSTGRYAGGPNLGNLPNTMSIRRLKNLIGDNPFFDGMNPDAIVNVNEFLSTFDGVFGWNNWHPTHFNKIKSTSGEWSMRGPQIMHRIDTGQSFRVKEFYNGKPDIPFSGFQSVAEALFSAIPYDFYYNSEKHGNWVNALQAGSCNCYDGANALIALASVFGFGGSLAHGTWNGVPHVYAVINGKKMDTTGWQQRRNWNGVSAGGPSSPISQNANKTVNVNIDMSNANINGVDDLDEAMDNAIDKALQKHFLNDLCVGV